MDESKFTELILFNVNYGNSETCIRLPYYDTVGDLKEEICKKLDIPPSKQIINCWYREPDGDNDILGGCCDSHSNYLVVYDYDELTMNTNMFESDLVNTNMSESVSTSYSHMESCAALEFIEYFSTNFDDRGILFHVCRLEDAINQACFTTFESRKILLLYFQNKDDKFAKVFGDNLTKSDVKEILGDKFFLLGWDVGNTLYHPALIEALSARSELSTLSSFIESKICAALLIVPVKNSFTLFSCMKTKVSKKDFLETLKKAKEFFLMENENEKDLNEDEKPVTDMGSTNYQQLMTDMLGDRDYDSFDYFEFDHLRSKIGFALYGPPEKENGYEEKQNKKIESLLKVIVSENNGFAKWKDRIIISFVYNCTEPLPSEKKKRSKKYADYNPVTDLTPIPLFILRKCKNSENPCRVIIDDSGRVYRSWRKYITQNKLPECEMILPLNGRYQTDENGKVKLERHLSPACGIDSKILQGADVTSTAAGLISGGIVIAAAIPTITVAPVALIAAGATGIGVGLYSLGRSAYTLYDRSTHKESLSFVNSEARGAYLNIVAGSLGFVGAGANIAVSQLASRGFNIGQGATAAVNMLSVANIGASGISFMNSGYDVFDQWWNENQTPSLLTIVQLSSSLLFFAHAVYNYKAAGTIIEESQARTLRDYQDSLRSNRHRKTLNKMMKETIRQNNGNVRQGQAEVIKTIIKIQNKDETFAALTRLNKQMNRNNVKFSAENGEIRLNGVSIDMTKFGNMDTNEAAVFFTTLPSAPDPSPNDVNVMSVRLQFSFKNINGQEIAGLAFHLLKMFGNTTDSIKDKIISAVAAIILKLLGDSPGCYDLLGQMFPGLDKYMRLFTVVSGFFQRLIDEVEANYQTWLATKDPTIKEPIFATLALDYAKRGIEIFEHISKVYFIGCNVTEAGLKELIKHFYTWFAKQAVVYEDYLERKQKRTIHSSSPTRKINCPDCGGVYYRD